MNGPSRSKHRIAWAPWIYLVWALEAKIVAIGSGDRLEPSAAARLDRRWQAIFGGDADE